jgi:hypothetical protein
MEIFISGGNCGTIIKDHAWAARMMSLQGFMAEFSADWVYNFFLTYLFFM